MSAPSIAWSVKALIEEHDHKLVLCPRLIAKVNFKFCRSENEMLPCAWVAGCWQMRIDIDRFLYEHYSTEGLNRIFGPPKPKIENLLELIDKAKKHRKEVD